MYNLLRSFSIAHMFMHLGPTTCRLHNLLGSLTLEKTDSPSLSNHQLSMPLYLCFRGNTSELVCQLVLSLLSLTQGTGLFRFLEYSIPVICRRFYLPLDVRVLQVLQSFYPVQDSESSRLSSGVLPHQPQVVGKIYSTRREFPPLTGCKSNQTAVGYLQHVSTTIAPFGIHWQVAHCYGLQPSQTSRTVECLFPLAA